MQLVYALLLTMLWVAGPGNCGMTDQLRKEALDAHNYLRRNVYPEAVNMNKLLWSDDLEKLADKAAKLCKFEHTTSREYASLGENLYLGGKNNFTEILTMMFLERELYDYKTQTCLAGTPKYTGPYTFLTTCGHYLQLVRSDMIRVGCSINTCTNPDGSSNNLAVCEYNKMTRQPPYRAKKPGEEPCELCGFEGYANDCEDELCIEMDFVKPKVSKGKRKCLNCGTMKYYGPYDYCDCKTAFYGEVCENSFNANAYSSAFLAACDKCDQEGSVCLNGATKSPNKDACQCICAKGFTGTYCETNIEEETNTLHIYLGGSKRYYSYYPVEKSVWRSVGADVTDELATALSAQCSGAKPHVKLSANYPAATINGSLRVGLHAKCGQQFLPKSDLATAAAGPSSKRIGDILAKAGVSVVATD